LLQEIGLDQADQLIAACGERLRTAIGAEDIVARFGEHQFAVLTRHSDHSHTQTLAEGIRAAFADHVVEAGQLALSATASVGGVQIGEKIASVTAVLGKASQCLQSASDIGGNRIELFDPGAADRAEEERIAAWVARIRDALDADRFVMNYQPLINLHGEPLEMYEAYLRMQAPGAEESGELVQPLSFLQIAEEHGLLWEIDRWVVGKAIQIIGERMRQGRRTTLLVKITQASLQDESLQQHVVEQLAKHGADGKLLVLQLPESKVFTNLRAAQEFQSRIYQYGVRVGLEQFGAGLNSFQLLNHFDAAFLKIDRGYMEELTSNPDHQQRVREIADKARELGRQTIAEFVQDAASMSFLFAAGIDYAQGHFLAAAGPEMDYEFQ
jgi:EAL domain-containing protein (putative c-di-GMP-specific phosphodiesterase class I)